MKKGDIVGRISYGKDIAFIVEKIISKDNKEVAILKGLTERIKADSDLNDLVLLDIHFINECEKRVDKQIEKRVSRYIEEKERDSNELKRAGGFKNFFQKINLKTNDNGRLKRMILNGRILHLDGDKNYAEKSAKYYKGVRLDAIVKNVSESKQQYVVGNLIRRYNPNVLVITGHDGMIKSQTGYNEISNYRNSLYFMNAVREARKLKGKDELIIFAGACQSYYEGLISVGANFASSPSRILIDFLDPLIVAERVAITNNSKFLTINQIESELKNGRNGVSGVGGRGQSREIFI